MLRLRFVCPWGRRAPAALLGMATLIALLGRPAPAVALDDPGAFLADLSGRALQELTVPDMAPDEKERRFRRLVSEGFDIPAIGRFVLGRYWRSASEPDQHAFLEVFEDMIVRRFLPLFDDYGGETLRVGTVRPFADNPDFFSVSSRIVRPKSEVVLVDWRIRRIGESFKIVDIVAEGVSIAVTLRAEYGSALKQNGGDLAGLIAALRERVANL